MKEEILNRLQDLPCFDKLRFVYVYGSSATGKVTERSDIDVALYYDIADERKMYDLLFLISGSVPDKYDICMFQLLPLYVRIEVFRGKLIYADDKGFVHDVAWETIKEYNDFEPRYKYILYGKLGLEGATLGVKEFWRNSQKHRTVYIVRDNYLIRMKSSVLGKAGKKRNLQEYRICHTKHVRYLCNDSKEQHIHPKFGG